MEISAGNSVSNARSSEYIQNPSDVQAEILHAIENEKKIITEQILMAENAFNVLNEQVCVVDNANKILKESGERVMQLLEKKMSLARSDQSSLIKNDDEPMEKIRKGNELDSQNTQNSSVTKRKAESPPAGASSSKIAKKEPFSCELCDVVVTSELTLRMHTQGKKHQQAVLIEQRMEQNGVVSIDRNLATVTGINSNRNLEQIAGDDTISKGTTPGVTTDGNAVQVYVADNANKILKESGERVKQLLEKKTSLARSDQSSLIKNDDEPMEKIRKGNELDSQNTQNSSVTKRKAESPPAGASSSKIAKKEPFSCELCDVVVTSELTLRMHTQGKKHQQAVLIEQRMEQNGVVSIDRNLATVTGINSNRNLEQIAGDDTISKGTTPGVTTDGNAVQVCVADNANKILKESGERVKQLLEKKTSLARSDQSSLIKNDDEPMEKIRKGNELDSQNTQNSSVIKRKAESLPAGASSSKIAKKEPFSCELCDVVVTSELTLRMHTQGKKHQQAVLIEQRMVQNGVVSIDRNLATVTGINSNRNLEQIAGDDTISKGTTSGVTADGNAVQVTQRTVGGHMIFKAVDGDIFGCEVCRVGPETVKAMNADKKEKEHLN